jgi:hypothetical protein
MRHVVIGLLLALVVASHDASAQGTSTAGRQSGARQGGPAPKSPDWA